MSVKTETLGGGIGLIEVKGPILGGAEADAFRKAVTEFVGKKCTKLLIDMGKVTFANSTAIGVLVSAYTTYARRDWKLKLCGLHKQVYTVMMVTKLNLVFDLYDTRRAALKSFA